MKEKAIATNFEPHKYVIFAQSTKIGTQENKAIHSTTNTDHKRAEARWGITRLNRHTPIREVTVALVRHEFVRATRVRRRYK